MIRCVSYSTLIWDEGCTYHLCACQVGSDIWHARFWSSCLLSNSDLRESEPTHILLARWLAFVQAFCRKKHLKFLHPAKSHLPLILCQESSIKPSIAVQSCAGVSFCAGHCDDWEWVFGSTVKCDLVFDERWLLSRVPRDVSMTAI